MFSSLSKFTSIPSTTTPLFANPDRHAGTSSDLQTPLDVPSTSSDDVPVVDSSPPTIEHPPRVRNPPPYLCDYHCYSTMFHHHEPQSYKEASKDPVWQQPMQEELQPLEKTHTWDLVDPPFDKTLEGCKWVYKIQTLSDEFTERYKARLVAKGFTQ